MSEQVELKPWVCKSKSCGAVLGYVHGYEVHLIGRYKGIIMSAGTVTCECGEKRVFEDRRFDGMMAQRQKLMRLTVD